MACTHCGERPVTGEYTLRFYPRAREPVSMQLALCGECLETLLGESDVELVAPEAVSNVDTSVETSN